MRACRWPDIRDQELAPLPGSNSLEIVIAAPGSPRAVPPEAARSWQQRCAANPRLHDGPVLSVTRIDAAAGRIECEVDRFARLADADAGIDLGVRLLGVKGLVIGRGADGAEHVLIARRGRETRVYGGMWEIAPAGGINVPAALPARLAERDVLAALAEEGREELGIDLGAAPARLVALVRDEVAHSVDLIARVEWPETVDPRRGLCGAGGHAWEYEDFAWLARADAGAFDRRSSGAIVGPMRAVLRWLGWDA